ncbi:hypothetical protein BLNAU_13428 [Blattamonas nauphoetae]|uniref:Uncharacterized protein n=1 Tax=Blattamonas nauphoetae TaxID=2049346 RepID=A0ABQ9XJM5_9EUKA|nr:hypothetical protein BLNAU_13428 [Blattamonas nauphoetae]
MDHHLDYFNRNDKQNNDILHLSSGIFELLDYPVTSTMLKLEGSSSTISHASPERQPVMNEPENERPQDLNHLAKGHTDGSHSLFLTEKC